MGGSHNDLRGVFWNGGQRFPTGVWLCPLSFPSFSLLGDRPQPSRLPEGGEALPKTRYTPLTFQIPHSDLSPQTHRNPSAPTPPHTPP